MPESNISVNEWSPGKKQAFRFSFIFLSLYILVNPNDVIPYFHIIQRFTRQPFYLLVNWFSGALLHIPNTLINSIHTSTDTTLITWWFYLLLPLLLLVPLCGYVPTENHPIIISLVRYFSLSSNII